MTAGTGHLPRFSMNAFLKFIFWNSCAECMLLHKFNIGMTSTTGLFDVGHIRHGFGILAWQGIMFSVALVTISRPLHPLHDHLGMKALLIFFLRLLMTCPTVHGTISGFLPTLGMFVVLDTGVTVRTGELPMD